MRLYLDDDLAGPLLARPLRQNAKRNMSPHDIVRAFRNFAAAGLPVVDHYYDLNPWQ